MTCSLCLFRLCLEFPYDFRNGIRWFDYDPTKWLISTMRWFGLAYDLRVFSENEIQKGKLKMIEKKYACAFVACY